MRRSKGMKSPVVKRSIVLSGRKTSVGLEDAFWSGLREIANMRLQTLSDLVGSIDAERRHSNPSSAVRLFVLDFYRSQVAGAGSVAERGDRRVARRSRDRRRRWP